MLKTLSQNQYTFDAPNKRIIFGVAVENITLPQILLITNVTTNVMFYQFNGGATLGGTLVGRTLTVAYDTTGMASTDELQIRLDVKDAVLLTDMDVQTQILYELKRHTLLLMELTGKEIKDEDVWLR